MEICKVDEEEMKEILGEIIDVYRDGYQGMEMYAYRRRRDIKNYLKWLYRCDNQAFLVCFEDKKIIGFISGARNWWDRVYGDIGEIHELVVRKEFQGRGIGKRLLEEELKILRRGNRFIGLWVGERNYRAIRFYESFGFRRVGKVGVWLRMIKEC